MSASIVGQGIAYCRQAQEIICNVWRYFSTTSSNGRRPVRYPIKETMRATGVGRSTFRKLRRNGPVSPKKKGPKTNSVLSKVDTFDRGVIRQIIQNLYANKIWPTLEIIFAKIRTEINFPGCKETLRRLLKSMGYRYRKRANQPDKVKERPDIVQRRHEFLRKMKKLRLTNRKIIYFGETWVNANHTVGYCWLGKDNEGGLPVPSGKGSRLIILHAGSADGFIPNCLLSFVSKSTTDYHKQMDGERFQRWFNEQLLDNGPYHSKLEDKPPTISNRGKK